MISWHSGITRRRTAGVTGPSNNATAGPSSNVRETGSHDMAGPSNGPAGVIPSSNGAHIPLANEAQGLKELGKREDQEGKRKKEKKERHGSRAKGDRHKKSKKAAGAVPTPQNL